MSAVLFIDPGSAGRGCACAAYVRNVGADWRLHAVWFERVSTIAGAPGPTELPPREPRVSRVPSSYSAIVVEKPVPQGARTLAARYEDLANLAWDGAFVAGAYAGSANAPIVAWPATDWRGVRGWKGGEAKPHNHRRLWAILEETERALLGGDATGQAIERACEKWSLKRGGIEGAKCYHTDVHNLLDAAAMGACWTGRLKRA